MEQERRKDEIRGNLLCLRVKEKEEEDTMRCRPAAKKKKKKSLSKKNEEHSCAQGESMPETERQTIVAIVS